MLKARCKKCNTELTSTSKVQFCGCSNQMRIVDDHLGANDLDQVILIEHEKSVKYHGMLTQEDLLFQENRRRRKVRKLNFEER